MSIELIQRLIDSFNQAEIRYCHWKSNYMLVESLAGATDLDLLVDRAWLNRSIELLLSLNFKPAELIASPAVPGIFHFYGFDCDADQLIHVHLFSSVLTGESFVKSHRLPFEEMLLRNTNTIDSMPVPDKAAELVIFVIRNMIKSGSLIDLVYQIRDEKNRKKELEWLNPQENGSESLALLEEYCPVIDAGLFTRCIKALQDSRSILEQIRLAFEVRERLRGYARHTAFIRAWSYAKLVWETVVRKITRAPKNKTLASGGAVIAFIGPEATGKSTLVESSAHWLGIDLAVQTVHAGKPPATWLTFPISSMTPLLRKLAPEMRSSRVEGHVDTNPGHPKMDGDGNKKYGIAKILYALRSVSLAYERRALLLRARHNAANGRIIICDRYPSAENGAMDSPRLEQDKIQNGLAVNMYNALARLEARLYHGIPAPDIVLRLSVSIETAKQRNRDRIKLDKESDAYLESRHRQCKTWHRPGAMRIYDISTEQSIVDTVRSVRQVIWDSL